MVQRSIPEPTLLSSAAAPWEGGRLPASASASASSPSAGILGAVVNAQQQQLQHSAALGGLPLHHRSSLDDEEEEDEGDASVHGAGQAAALAAATVVGLDCSLGGAFSHQLQLADGGGSEGGTPVHPHDLTPSSDSNTSSGNGNGGRLSDPFATAARLAANARKGSYGALVGVRELGGHAVAASCF